MAKSITEKKLEEGIEKVEKIEEKAEEKMHQNAHDHSHENGHDHHHEKTEEKIKEESKTEKKAEKKPVQEKKKKTEAVVTAENIPISAKDSAAICRFIKKKKIGDAIADLEAVLRFKKAVPMSGEIPHRKGKRMMSGRFPKKASENFIRLLKSLNANSNYNGLIDPTIVEAYANIGVRPFGKFGAVRKKRTHIKIVAKDIGGKK